MGADGYWNSIIRGMVLETDPRFQKFAPRDMPIIGKK